MTEQNKNSPLITYIAYAYLAIPFMIFVAGWFRLYLAIPCLLVVAVSLFFACRHAPRLWVPSFDRENRRKMICSILLITVITLVWLYFSGVGGFAFQNYDHKWRNAVFELLVSAKWPVIVTETAGHFENPVALVYYFAFWLPAAVVAKAFGLAAGYAFQFIWAFIGLMLCFYFISALQNKLRVWFIVAFIFFGGLDILGKLMLENSSNFSWLNTLHIENWAYGFQYSSFTTQLFWVFNQAVPAWLITLMLLNQKDNRSLVYLFSFSLMSCTLPAIGMIPFFLYYGVRRCVVMYDKKLKVRGNLMPLLRDIFTFENVAGGGVIGISSYLFLKINVNGSTIEKMDMSGYFMSYLLFVFFEFLIYFLLIGKAESGRGIYYVALAVLLIVPWFRAGALIDFVMRVSIPGLVVLYVLVADALCRYRADKKRLLAAALVVVLIIGGITAQHEIERTAVSTINRQKKDEPTLEVAVDLIEDGYRQNFFGEYEQSFFFKYIAK